MSATEEDESVDGERFEVRDEADQRRYVLRRDGEVVSHADYHIDRPVDQPVDQHDGGDVIVIPHVETAWPHRGNGYAARLMAGVVEDSRARGRRIVPLCPFAAGYLDDHPDDRDVVASA